MLNSLSGCFWMRRWVRVAACWMVLATACGSGAWAQRGTPDASPERMLADQLLVLAMESLGVDRDPRPDQFTRAQVLLDLALGLVPHDAEAWRLKIELTDRMGDRVGHLNAMKRYSSLRPEDDAAQLDWIMASVGEHQTLEQRLHAVEKILNAQQSERLSKPLRSRLSSFVAKTALEMGDTKQFRRSLRTALRLDRANPEAAHLMVEWLWVAGATPAVAGQAMMNLVSTDPMNVVFRRRLAQLLFSQNVYDAAAQQYEVVHRLDPQFHDEQMVYQWVHSLAAGGQLNQAMDLLTQFERLPLKQPVAASQPADPAADPAADAPADPGRQPDVGLPMDLELLRLALFQKSNQTARARGSFQRITNLMQDRAPDGDGGGQADLIWLGLLMDQAVPDTQAWDQLKAVLLQDAGFLARVTGWMHLREGNGQAARQALGALASQDPFAAYGMAVSYGQVDHPDRLKYLHEVVAMAPGHLAGLMATCDLVEAGVRVQPTADGAVLTQRMDQWPRKMVSPDPSQDRWTSLTVHLEHPQFQYLRPIPVRLTLRNTTDFPLSLGPRQAIPSQVLLHIYLRHGGSSMGRLQPMVIDMRRRLRVPARGVLEVTARLDHGGLGSVLSMNPVMAIGFDVTAVLGPRFEAGGQLLPEALGASGAAYLIQRNGSVLGTEQVDQWIEHLVDTDPIRQMLGAAWLGRASTFIDDPEQGQEVSKKISDAMAGQYHQLTPVGQAWMVRFLPAVGKDQELFSVVHEAAQRTDDPVVQVVYAATQVSNPESVILDRMLRHRDPRLVAFGQALRVGLQADSENQAEQTDRTPNEEPSR